MQMRKTTEEANAHQSHIHTRGGGAAAGFGLPRGAQEAAETSETKDICMGFSDITRLFGRAVVAWTCYRGLQLCNEAQRPISTTKQWDELQRKIIVSLLVNHKFWGDRDCQHVLLALGRDLPDDGQDYAQLFQRALLPTGIEGTLQTEDAEKDVDKDGARLDPADVRVPHWVK